MTEVPPLAKHGARAAEFIQPSPAAGNTQHGGDPCQPKIETGPDVQVGLGKPVSLEKLAKLPAPFRDGGTVTAGNASGVNDGACALLLASEAAVREHDLKPRARIVSTAVIGSEPTIMLTGPVPATEKALRKAGLQIEDIDLFELNEAFASVVMRFQKYLDVPDDKINVNGGAIAMGHPLGATGAMILGTCLDELERRDLQRGLVTLCVGGGMGIATVIERV